MSKNDAAAKTLQVAKGLLGTDPVEGLKLTLQVREEFRKILELDPANMAAIHNLGETESALGDYHLREGLTDDALEHFQSALGHYDDTLKHYTETREPAFNDASIEMPVEKLSDSERAYICRKKTLFGKAYVLKKISDICSDFDSKKAELYLDDAEKTYREVLEGAAPQDTTITAAVNLANILLKKGQTDDAESHYLTALSIAGDDNPYRDIIAQRLVMLKLWRIQEAKESYKPDAGA